MIASLIYNHQRSLSYAEKHEAFETEIIVSYAFETLIERINEFVSQFKKSLTY